MAEDEDVIVRLLHLAGPRHDVSPERAARVRGTVHSRWRAQMRRRAYTRRTVAASGVLATAAALVMGVRLLAPRPQLVPAETLASIEQVMRSAPGDARFVQGQLVDADEWLETGRARIALRLTNGTSLRLDTETRARLVSRTVIDIAWGGAYIDTSAHAPGLEIRTPFGIARDVGTQFEVRVTADAMRVRVRTGLIELQSGTRSVTARPATEVSLGPRQVVTKPVAVFGPEWQWATRLAPPFDAQGRSLAAFLEHVSREQGWVVRYADGQLARDASGIILSGSLEGLEPLQAVAIALRSSGLAHTLEDGDMVVTRLPPQQ